MIRREILNLCAITALGLALLPRNAVAQLAKDVLGTWTLGCVDKPIDARIAN